MESVFKLLCNMKHLAYQLVRNVHQATVDKYMSAPSSSNGLKDYGP